MSDDDQARPAAPESRTRAPARRRLRVLTAVTILLAAVAVGLFLQWRSSPRREAAAAMAGDTRPAVVPKAVPTAAPALPPAADSMIAWSPSEDGEGRTYRIDGYAMTLATRPGAHGGRDPVLRVRAPTGEEAEVVADDGGREGGVRFGIGKLDPKSSGEQVVFAVFTGGAHCCDHVRVLNFDRGRWSVVDLGVWDGDALAEFPTDEDGDDVRDFVMGDDRFLYAFTSYAESRAPPQIIDFVGGRPIDVSAAVRFRALYEADLRDARAGCLQHRNGDCAAFVAEAARIGRRAWAWSIMLANYDRSSRWVFPDHCATPVAGKPCPPGQSLRAKTFPQALDWFLRDNGYAPPAPADDDFDSLV